VLWVDANSALLCVRGSAFVFFFFEKFAFVSEQWVRTVIYTQIIHDTEILCSNLNWIQAAEV
jgi:hypothetical protein